VRCAARWEYAWESGWVLELRMGVGAHGMMIVGICGQMWPGCLACIKLTWSVLKVLPYTQRS